jgi:hypothetical protein
MTLTVGLKDSGVASERLKIVDRREFWNRKLRTTSLDCVDTRQLQYHSQVIHSIKFEIEVCFPFLFDFISISNLAAA